MTLMMTLTLSYLTLCCVEGSVDENRYLRYSLGRGISRNTCMSIEYVPGHLHHRHHITDGSHLPHGVLSLGKWSLVSFFLLLLRLTTYISIMDVTSCKVPCEVVIGRMPAGDFFLV